MELDLKPRVYHFYDSKNPLHDEYNEKISNEIKIFKLNNPRIKFISVDISELEPEADDFVKKVTGK